jgi:hypothetical protein
LMKSTRSIPRLRAGCPACLRRLARLGHVESLSAGNQLRNGRLGIRTEESLSSAVRCSSTLPGLMRALSERPSGRSDRLRASSDLGSGRSRSSEPRLDRPPAAGYAPVRHVDQHDGGFRREDLASRTSAAVRHRRRRIRGGHRPLGRAIERRRCAYAIPERRNVSGSGIRSARARARRGQLLDRVPAGGHRIVRAPIALPHSTSAGVSPIT